MASVVALENAHCSSIFYVVWYLVPAFHYSVREKMSPGIQPCGLWPQIERTVRTTYWIRIRIGIQPKMLDPDPDEINVDPQPCFKETKT
jgi:hypothetical protein